MQHLSPRNPGLPLEPRLASTVRLCDRLLACPVHRTGDPMDLPSLWRNYQRMICIVEILNHCLLWGIHILGTSCTSQPHKMQRPATRSGSAWWCWMIWQVPRCPYPAARSTNLGSKVAAVTRKTVQGRNHTWAQSSHPWRVHSRAGSALAHGRISGSTSYQKNRQKRTEEMMISVKITHSRISSCSGSGSCPVRCIDRTEWSRGRWWRRQQCGIRTHGVDLLSYIGEGFSFKLSIIKLVIVRELFVYSWNG